jgi:hypothetical protein
MADNYTIKIEGLDDVMRSFDQIPKKIVARAFFKALQASGYVIEKEVLIRTPVRSRLYFKGTLMESMLPMRGSGALRAAITTVVTLDSKSRGGYLEVGFGELGYIARFVEYGHRLVTHRPGKKEIGQVPPYPFMRPALEAATEIALDTFTATLSEYIAEGEF